MLRRFSTLASVTALALAVACGQSAEEGAGSTAGGAGNVGATGGSFGLGGAAGGLGTAGGDASDKGGSPYPSGPYGTQTGDVLADLELLGYVRDATTGLAYEAPLGATSLAAIRASTAKKHAVFHVSGFT
jgi:hypothetical protein